MPPPYLPWIPTSEGITIALRGTHKEDEDGGTPGFCLLYGGLAPLLPFWIPAFAGMTRPAGLMRWLVEVFAGHFHRAYPSLFDRGDG